MARFPLRPAAVAVTALAVTGPARAEIAASDPQAVLDAMHDYGFAATMEVDTQGDPKIASRVSQSRFVVFFYGCTDNTDCASIQFFVGYDQEESVSALMMNEWNRSKLFSKATVDEEGDPALEMDVNLDFDGIGPENFADVLDIWRLSVEEFEDFIDW